MMRRLVVIGRVGVWLVIAPWVALFALVRVTRWSRRAVHRVVAGARDEARCQSGHINDLTGRWTCRCGFVFFGYAFDECPSCQQIAGWIACERCGLGIRGPG